MDRRKVLKGIISGAAGAAVGPVLGGSANAAGAKRVAILGGGVAGLSAAHELATRGFAVSVYESRAIPGGKARSFGAPGSATGGRKDLPAEHGFRFFPGFYKHLPDTMRRIPYGNKPGGVADNLVAASTLHFSRAGLPDIIYRAGLPPNLFDAIGELLKFLTADTGVTSDEFNFFLNKIYIWLTSCDERRATQFEQMSWWDFTGSASQSAAYLKFLGEGLTRTLVAARADKISAKTNAAIFVQLTQSQLAQGTAVDRLLNGPTNEVWIDPWIAYLRQLGVVFNFGAQIQEITMASGLVSGARVSVGGVTQTVTADAYILAVPVEVARGLIPAAAKTVDPALGKLGNLVTDWMTGIQFYLDRDVPITAGHTSYYDAPWALTSISQKQFWPNVNLANYGDGSVRGIISVDISNWDAPGIVYGKTARQCTLAQIADEVLAQMRAHFDADVAAQFNAARVLRYQLDTGIRFPSGGAITNDDPLLINTAGSWASRPEAVTGVRNFFLAADYVRTYTDLATMEGANEAARRAVNGVLNLFGSLLPRCMLWPLDEGHLFDLEKANDKVRWLLGLPNAHQ